MGIITLNNTTSIKLILQQLSHNSVWEIVENVYVGDFLNRMQSFPFFAHYFSSKHMYHYSHLFTIGNKITLER